MRREAWLPAQHRNAHGDSVLTSRIWRGARPSVCVAQAVHAAYPAATSTDSAVGNEALSSQADGHGRIKQRGR